MLSQLPALASHLWGPVALSLIILICLLSLNSRLERLEEHLREERSKGRESDQKDC